MDAMKKAIMNRRMKLAGEDIDMDEMKDANLNNNEGSQDDLDIARELGEAPGSDQEDPTGSTDGMAPDISAEASDMDDSPIVQEEEQMPTGNQASLADYDKMFTKDDVGKPGIRGKAAAKMMAAIQAMKRK